MGQLHELLGDQEQARDWYQRFLKFWDASDMDLEEIQIAREKIST
jgi:hypothetical protein